MNKKKGLLIGSIVLAVVAVIGLVIVLIAINKEDGKGSVSLTESSLTDTELIIETEDDTEADTEADSEESTEEDTTEEETTEVIEVVLPEETPEEIVGMDVITLGYDTYMEAYLYLLDMYEQVYGDGFTCSLIDYDVSLELELLIDVNKELTLYKYEYGNLYKIIDRLDYGQFSSGGYEYAIIVHSIRRVDTEYDGLIKNETYSYIDLDVTEDNNDTLNLREHVYHLKQTFFDDVNENGVPDEGEATGEEYARYYVNGQRVYSLEYYNAAISQGEYIPFKGELSLHETRLELYRPALESVEDRKCQDSYKEIIKEYESKYPNGECKYALIDCDGDKNPELVCDTGTAISVYTFDYGRVLQLIDNCNYEEAGNTGYEYLPGKNTIRYTSYNQENGEYAINYVMKNDEGQLVECEESQTSGYYYMIMGYYSSEEIGECLVNRKPGGK